MEFGRFKHDFLKWNFNDVIDPDELLAFGSAFTHFCRHADAHCRETHVHIHRTADLVLEFLFAVTLERFELHLVLRLTHDFPLYFPDVEHQHIRVIKPVYSLDVHVLTLHQ